MSINEHNLNIHMYSLEDLLGLFDLTYNISQDDLKRAKKVVLMTHPDKSKLDSKYFLFYKKAFDVVVRFYDNQNKQNQKITPNNTAYTPRILFNGEIITYSKYYRFNLIAIGILILLNVSLNILFIKVFYYGIEGVAIASLISMLLFNFSKLLFIYQKFRILPFDKSYLKLILVFSLVLFVSANLPNLDTVLWNLIYKTIFYKFYGKLIFIKYLCIQLV